MGTENNGVHETENQLYPWSQTESAKMNPILIMAEVLAARAEYKGKIDIRDAKASDASVEEPEELVPGYKTVFANQEAQDVLWRINNIPEIAALTNAFTSLLEPDYDLNHTTTWDENTKRGVLALYHLNRAKREQLTIKEWTQRGKEWGEYMEASIASEKTQAQDLFAAGGIHITRKIMRELVTQIIERELRASS